jgi:hypothetical protein
MKTSLPPRVAIECIDQAIVLGKRNFWPLLRLALVPFLAYAVIIYLFRGRTTPVGIVLANVLVYAIYGLLEAATVAGAWELLHGRPPDVGATWRLVSRHAISVVVASWVRILLILLGAILLVIPGLYFLTIYFGVPTVNVIEGLGVRASLVRSRSLALGSLSGILLSMGGLWILVAVVAILIPRFLTAVGVPALSVLRPFCALAWGAFVVPFRAALAACVYLEIRRRKEGYDLEHMMASLPGAATREDFA